MVVFLARYASFCFQRNVAVFKPLHRKSNHSLRLTYLRWLLIAPLSSLIGQKQNILITIYCTRV